MVRLGTITLSLSLAFAAAPASAAEGFGPTTPERAVTQARLAGAPPFAGVGSHNLRRLVQTGDGLSCADTFRRDEIRIWSASSGSTWTLLPPHRLGAAAELDLAGAE